MTNPYILTLAAWLLTLTGQAPLSAWEPLFEDIIRIAAEHILNATEYILRFMEVLM